MPALLFGSISTIADTSELQRAAFNAAFQAHDLGWTWDRSEYIAQLERSGGVNRIAEYAAERGESVDAAAVHATKSDIFRKRLAESPIAPRPGVAETITGAKRAGLQVALVTTTSPDNVKALLQAVGADIAATDFDLIVDSSDVDDPKPDKAVYAFALDTLGEPAGSCVAIEDNLGGVGSAVTAGVSCVAFPNENTSGHDFADAVRVVGRLDLDELRSLVPNN
jgi:HAD superfamily hydrolase (TIGR01509 family)